MTDTRKTLGRCPEKHVNLVSLDTLDSACTKQKGKTGPTCGKPMVEWALNGHKEG